MQHFIPVFVEEDKKLKGHNYLSPPNMLSVCISSLIFKSVGNRERRQLQIFAFLLDVTCLQAVIMTHIGDNYLSLPKTNC